MMTLRRLALLTMGLAAGLSGCGGPPTATELLCQRYCQGQQEAVPTGELSTCGRTDEYVGGCAVTCLKDLEAAREECRTPLARAYACGADHTWFCVPKEDGGRTLTQFDTCREAWDAVSACEQAPTP